MEDDELIRDIHWWSRCIADHFLPLSGPHEPATLPVDPISLSEASGLAPEEAVQSLCDAIKGVMWEGGDPYRSIAATTSQWAEDPGEAPPPALAFVAACILAAFHMGADPRVASHNFYVHYRRLLHPDSGGRGAPPGFYDWFHQLWDVVEWWLDEHLGGERGHSTLERPATANHAVDRAKTQATLRAQDRRRVRQFLDDVGFEPGDEIDGRLLKHLRLWARRLGEQGQRLANVLEQGDPDLIQSVVAAEARRLGSTSSGAARRTLRLEVVLDLDSPSIALALRAGEQSPDELELSAGWPGLRLKRDALAPGWYEPDVGDSDSVSRALEDGVSVPTAAGWDVELRAAGVLALRYDEQLGALASVPTIAFDESHHLLVRDDLVEEVHRADLPRLPEVSASVVPDGWTLLGPFTVGTAPDTVDFPDLARLFGVRHTVRARLIGGFRVGDLKHAYISGGPPALQIPDHLDRPVQVAVEHSSGRTSTFEVDEARVVSLHGVCDEPGLWRLEVDEQILTLDILESLAEEAVLAEEGCVTHAGSTELLGYVGGPEQAEPLLLPRGAGEVVAIGAHSDQVARVHEPAWMVGRLGPLSWSAVELRVPFRATWYIVTPPTGDPVAHCLDPQPPSTGERPRRLWVRSVLAAAALDQDSLFSQYKALAARCQR